MRGRNIGLCMAVTLVCSLIWTVSGSAASSKFAAKVNGSGIKKATLDAAMTNFIENQTERIFLSGYLFKYFFNFRNIF